MAKKGSRQIWLEYSLVRAILSFLRILPLSVATWFGISVGRLGYHLLGRLRGVGLRNLKLAFPEKSEAERVRILRGAFRNLGRVMAVVSGFDDLTAGNLPELIEFRPDAEFAAAYEKTKTDGRGRIILGAHMGNWELQAFSFPVFFEPLTFLARRMDNPRIDAMVLAIRTRLGNKQIDKMNSAAPILRALRAGGSIGMLADVNGQHKEGVFVPFFGIQACTAAGVAMLALRANAVIVPMFAIWNGDENKYFIVHDKIIDPQDTGDRQADILETTALCTAAIERVIRAYPDQWIWIHKRWKTRPPGEPEIYEQDT